MLTHHFSSAPATQLLSNGDTLTVISLTRDCAPMANGHILSGIEEVKQGLSSEVWNVAGPVSRGQTGHSYWSKNDDIICVAHWLSRDDCRQIERATYHAYSSMLSVAKQQGFIYPFRFWNYLPGINEGEGDEEMYKHFCTGRLNAFRAAGIEPASFPAASALGHHSEGAVFYVFASHVEPKHFKNEKQVNAYEYPRQYGITSPSFARATAITLKGSYCLFISGTASIVGHETVEVGHLERQLAVTANNIEHLLTNANPEACTLTTLKVYVRHQQHVERTKSWLKERYPQVDAVFTIADICRKDLLVEIECFCV